MPTCAPPQDANELHCPLAPAVVEQFPAVPFVAVHEDPEPAITEHWSPALLPAPAEQNEVPPLDVSLPLYDEQPPVDASDEHTAVPLPGAPVPNAEQLPLPYPPGNANEEHAAFFESDVAEQK